MSTDLSRRLILSQGQHDPLDGLITYQQLRVTWSAAGLESETLHTAVDDLARTCAAEQWLTTDPLGLGGLLIDLYRAAQLQQHGHVEPPRLLSRLRDVILPGLRQYARQNQLQLSTHHRLGFRELGLAIGLRAVQRLLTVTSIHAESVGGLDRIEEFFPLAERIEDCWRDPANRGSSSWTEHRDINEVMLATSLSPDGFLGSVGGTAPESTVEHDRHADING